MLSPEDLAKYDRPAAHYVELAGRYNADRNCGQGLRPIGTKLSQTGLCPDPPGAKPLDLIHLKMNGFPKALGLWWVQGKALAFAFAV